MGWTSYLFPVVHATETLAIGETEVIYSLDIPAGGYGFIYAVANNYFDGIKWYWRIDGALVEPNPIERQLGLVNAPKRFDPPLLVKSNIEVTAYNGTTEEANLEWLMDGFVYVKSD